MRILLLVDCVLPSTRSSAKLVHDLAVELHRQGHDPVVAAPDDALETDCDVREAGGVTTLRIRTGRIKGAGLVTRGWNEARLSAVMWKRGGAFFRSNPCDLVAWYSPSIFFGPLVRRLKRLWGCPGYLILRDIFPRWAVDAGVLRKGPVYLYFRSKEKLQYRTADVIGVQSPANLKYFEEPGAVRPPRLEVLYNWTDPAVPDPAPLGLDGKVVFFYGGNLGVAQDVDNLVRLAGRLADEPSAHLLLVGEGSEAVRLRGLIAEKGLRNIEVRDAVDQERYLSMVAAADVGLISLDRHLRTQNLPGKMLSYMQCSIPILASVNPGNDLREIVEKADAGLVSWNGEDDAFAANARLLAGDAERRRTMGRNARALLEETFTVERAARQILAASVPAVGGR